MSRILFHEIIHDVCSSVKNLIWTSLDLVDLCADLVRHPYDLLKVTFKITQCWYSIVHIGDGVQAPTDDADQVIQVKGLKLILFFFWHVNNVVDDLKHLGMLQDKFENWDWLVIFFRGHFSILGGSAVSDQVGPEPQQVLNDNFILFGWIVIIKINDVNEFSRFNHQVLTDLHYSLRVTCVSKLRQQPCQLYLQLLHVIVPIFFWFKQD